MRIIVTMFLTCVRYVLDHYLPFLPAVLAQRKTLETVTDCSTPMSQLITIIVIALKLVQIQVCVLHLVNKCQIFLRVYCSYTGWDDVIAN